MNIFKVLPENLKSPTLSFQSCFSVQYMPNQWAFSPFPFEECRLFAFIKLDHAKEWADKFGLTVWTALTNDEVVVIEQVLGISVCLGNKSLIFKFWKNDYYKPPIISTNTPPVGTVGVKRMKLLSKV